MAEAKAKTAAKAAKDEAVLSVDTEAGPRIVSAGDVAEFAKSLTQDSQPDFCRGVIPETGEQVVIKARLYSMQRHCANMLGEKLDRPEGPAIVSMASTETVAEQNAPPAKPKKDAA